ncbi:ExeA family protein [Vandammella animalimorsus]|uniref:Transposase n=1 Tax=Vandammella animalimorsus TaxID=2029117 RepID=A0A2A2A4I0_9BURK|nr:AAA family ATPase [Vandammella animalimorsus]PAT32894.1 transposase [Vandammella animalimorsus]
MLRAKNVMVRLCVRQRELAAHVGVSDATVAQAMNHGVWPRRAGLAETMKVRVEDYLRERGARADELATLWQTAPENEVPLLLRSRAAAEALIPGQQADSDTEDLSMLLTHQTLTPEARRQFRIVRDPFVNELAGMDDVFMSPDISYAYAAMRQTAKHGGMLILAGQSGSGKSVLRKALVDWIHTDREPITVIEPYVINMTGDDQRGKKFNAADIVSAIIRTLDDSAPIRQTMQARMAQMHKMLKDSANMGQKHVVIIEEGHDIAKPTLRSFKRFFEVEDGFKKLLAIIVIGQDELARKWENYDPTIREVQQRGELIKLPPLDNHVEQYLRHKLKRVELDYDAIFERDVADAIRGVLRAHVADVQGGRRVVAERSICHPLAVNNLVTRALNQAVRIGAAKVNGALIAAAAKGD